MRITEEGYLLTQTEYDEYQELKTKNKYNSLGIKKKENITVSRSEHRTPKHIQDIENFLNKLR